MKKLFVVFALSLIAGCVTGTNEGPDATPGAQDEGWVDESQSGKRDSEASSGGQFAAPPRGTREGQLPAEEPARKR